MVALGAYLLFLLWHDLPQAPLSRAEIEAGFAEARKALQAHNRAPMPQLQRQMMELLSNDDGKSFIMVNLVQYRETAQYPAGSGFAGTPQDAESRYNRLVLPELLKRGSYPVFAGQVSGSFIKEASDADWQHVALVRYRSRRDLLNMAIALAQKDADIHKWAALEKTQVFPAQEFFSLLFLRFFVALLLFVPALWLTLRRQRQ